MVEFMNGIAHGEDDEYDLICIGFGPASLAIAIALQDANLLKTSKVLFLEKQESFIWHAGMLLPGSRMQISFIKDLATLRNPRSEFTFINYLHSKNRLVQFLNLGTFLPLREEYNDYMQWCARSFDNYVSYGEEVIAVDPVEVISSKVESFSIRSQRNGKESVRKARHVVIAVGGRPNIPKSFPQNHSRVVHSSQYALHTPKILADFNKPYNIAVVGGGQSAAEILMDVHSKYPFANVTLYIKGSALKPSDDSPLYVLLGSSCISQSARLTYESVNEVFNPDRVDDTFSMGAQQRDFAITEDRATNYGVVRLELLERIYEELYAQRLRCEDASNWRLQICPRREIIAAEIADDDTILTTIKDLRTGEVIDSKRKFDILLFATGYRRDMHEQMLGNAKHLMPKEVQTKTTVRRDYSVVFDKTKVNSRAGIWLQGCNEATHGLSDTLLSILSVRAGEVVNSVFYDKLQSQNATQNGYHTPPEEKILESITTTNGVPLSG